MSLSFLPFYKPCITERNIHAVTKSLKNLEKDRVNDFEQNIARYCGAKYAVAFSSGKLAKMAAYFAIDWNISDWLITSPNTSISSVCAAISGKNRIYLIDIDLKTGMMDLQLLRNKTKLNASRGRPIILPFHFTGNLLDVQAIDQMLCHPEAIIIEDASQAFGSSYPDGSKVGCCAFSQMTLFSFDLNKMITTGQGGMVTTNDEKIFHRLKIFRDQGVDEQRVTPSSTSSESTTLNGYNHLTNFQAALGLSQFEELELFIQKRRSIVEQYCKAIQGIPHLTLLNKDLDKKTAPHIFVVQIDFAALKTTKEKVLNFLLDKGIETSALFTPLYQQPTLKYCLDSSIEYPNMDFFLEQALALPLYVGLNKNDVDHICNSLKFALR